MIVVPAGAPREQRPGRLLAEILQDQFQVALPVVVGAAPEGRTPILVGLAAAPAVAAAIGRERHLPRPRGLPPPRRRPRRDRRGLRRARRALRRVVARAARAPLGQRQPRRAQGGGPRLAGAPHPLGARVPAGAGADAVRAPLPPRLPPPLQVQRPHPRGRRRHAPRHAPGDLDGLAAHGPRVVRARRDDAEDRRGHPARHREPLRRVAPRRGGRRRLRREGRRAPPRGVGRGPRPRDRARDPGALALVLHRLRPPRAGRGPGHGVAGLLLPVERGLVPRPLRRDGRVPRRAAAEARPHRPRRVARGRFLPALPRQGPGPPVRGGRAADPAPPRREGPRDVDVGRPPRGRPQPLREELVRGRLRALRAPGHGLRPRHPRRGDEGHPRHELVGRGGRRDLQASRVAVRDRQPAGHRREGLGGTDRARRGAGRRGLVVVRARGVPARQAPLPRGALQREPPVVGRGPRAARTRSPRWAAGSWRRGRSSPPHRRRRCARTRCASRCRTSAPS